MAKRKITKTTQAKGSVQARGSVHPRKMKMAVALSGMWSKNFSVDGRKVTDAGAPSESIHTMDRRFQCIRSWFFVCFAFLPALQRSLILSTARIEGAPNAC
jgi:hypothetical protein